MFGSGDRVIHSALRLRVFAIYTGVKELYGCVQSMGYKDGEYCNKQWKQAQTLPKGLKILATTWNMS